MNRFRRVVTGVLIVMSATSMMAAVRIRAVGLNPAPGPVPRAVYGTVIAYDDATKTLTLLGGGIVIDVSHARVVGIDGNDTLNPIRAGLQVSIQLEATMTAAGRLSAWLVEQKTPSPASMTGPVDSIDLANGTFTVAGVVVRATANTVWKGRQGQDVRALADLQVGEAVNLDLDRDDHGVIAQQVFVVGFIPQMTPNFFGFVTKIEGDLWTITTSDNAAIVVRVSATTILNSADGIGRPGLGEWVEVTTSIPDGNNPPNALVITDFPPPQQQIAFSYAVFGNLTDIKPDSLTVTDLNGHTLTLPTDANTKYYRGAALGDYVEVRVRVDDATKAQVVVQVVQTNRTIRMGITGVVNKIEGDTWTIGDVWKVIVTPHTIISNNPRVGDTVRVTGLTEHGSNTIQADEIDRL
jgi:hypothetical protein